MTWLRTPTHAACAELANAVAAAARLIRIDRYRSRTSVLPEHITTAYSWAMLYKIENDERVSQHISLYYITRALTRGVETEEAVEAALRTISEAITSSRTHCVLTFNTSTNAAASEALQNFLSTNENYTELNARALVTTTPNHKIRIYKHTAAERVRYVVLNNLDTPEVVFKIATAILLDLNPFGEFTATLASGYLIGDGDGVSEALQQYFAAYNANRQERAIRNALNNLTASLTQVQEQTYTRKIERAQQDLDNLYSQIREYTEILNTHKAEYLLYKLTDDNAKLQDLTRLLESSKDKLAYIECANNRLALVYTTPLLYWEPQIAQRYFDSTRQNIMNSATPAVQQLLKDIFINGTHTLMIQSGVEFDLQRKDVYFTNPNGLLGIRSTSELNGMFNPHHYYYNCWGDNKSLIVRALNDHDYVTAVLQAFAAIAGINVSDTAVITKFVEREIDEFRNTPCIKVNETAEIITCSEYIRRFTQNASN